MAAKRNPPPAKPANLSQLARDYGVSRETLRSWRSQGTDLSDKRQLAERVATMHGAKSESLTAIKRRKLELECERIESAIRREGVGWIRMESAHRVVAAFCAVTKAMLASISGNLPGMLEGATPMQIHVALEAAHHDMLTTLSNHELCENHPEMIRCFKEMERLDAKNLCHECRQPKS